ncbi:MAG: hypothetical protein KatS3mg060_1017 [Dehalococcoidia bacterium]|jgi:hypothetical protein|nr:MAG: hypothetical protein KatS3mg060_1017 [Dehalococcoidia bacterium]
MACPSCGAELVDETAICQACEGSSSANLPAVLPPPAYPVRVARPPLPSLLRPVLPIAGGVAAVAVMASLAVVGLRLRPPVLRLPRRAEHDSDVPLIEIDESIVIRTRSARVRVR